MRKIRIGFSAPKDFKIGSALIKKFEGTPYSHIFIVMESSNGSPLPFDKVFEASYGDVHCLTYDNFKAQNVIYLEHEIEVTNEVYYKAANWLWDQLQKPYAFNQLIKIGFNISFGKKGADSYICTELAGRMLRDHVGVEIHKSLDYIGLKDMHEIVRKL